MELQENSIIVSDRLDGVFDVELRNHFTHAYCTAGECEVTYNGESVRMAKGDCVPSPRRCPTLTATASRASASAAAVSICPTP